MYIKKSLLIQKEAKTIFNYLNDFHNWPQWSPWLIADPNTSLNIDLDGKYYNWEGDVTGYWENEALTLLVNHWPSRRGGQKRSQASRIKAAQLQLKILDSLQRAIPAGYFLSMGDFNDNPNDKNVALLSEESTFYEGYQPLYNPMKNLFQKGI